MRLALFICLLPVCFFWQRPPGIKAFHISGHAQGTTYSIIYYAADSIVTAKQTDSILNKIDSSLSLYKSYSLISRFNRSSTGLPIDDMLRVVVKRSIEISRETGGVFDITVEPLVQAWGFGAERITRLPDDAAIKSLLHCVGNDKIRLSSNGLFKSRPCVHIDVNGIAQGYSVDLLADFLEGKKIENYLVEVGGEIRVKGRKQPSGEKMTIGIESPSDNDADPFPIRKMLRLDHGAVTTSGNYHKYYMMGSKKISHLIDPRTGYPLQNEMISVTVLAADAITADGYDNALMGLGLEKAMRFVEKKKNIEAYFIYHTANGAIADTATAGFYKWVDK